MAHNGWISIDAIQDVFDEAVDDFLYGLPTEADTLEREHANSEVDVVVLGFQLVFELVDECLLVLRFELREAHCFDYLLQLLCIFERAQQCLHFRR